jgi:putative addiction module CopG family antidote
MEVHPMSETQSLDQFVKEQLQSGKYGSYEAMVEAGLRLLQEHEASLDHIAEKLRPAIEEFRRGHPGVAFDVEDILQRGMERLASKNSTP